MTRHFYIPFYAEAYLADTQHLSLEEQGAYMRLLCFMWMRGGYLRDDDKELSRLLGLHVNKWKKMRETLGVFLQKHPPGLLTQKRLIHEYQKAEAKRDSKRQNAHARWQAETSKNNEVENANASVSHMQNGCETPLFADASADANHISSHLLSISRSKIKKIRSDLGQAKSCGQVVLSEQEMGIFTQQLVELFRQHKLQPPSDYDIIRQWMKSGFDPFGHILPVITELLSRNQQTHSTPPRSWKYFAKEIYAAGGR
jgi:uncharacterized protein YdaU (DUF1376 family)